MTYKCEGQLIDAKKQALIGKELPSQGSISKVSLIRD